MLKRTHVAPFLREAGGELRVEPLVEDPDGRVIAFLDRLCRLVRGLEGSPRATVVEALRRQERRVRDRRRLDGLARTLLDACRFAPHPLADVAPAVREAAFAERGRLWPPTPGDDGLPYWTAAAALGLTADEALRALYADLPDRRVLARAPEWDGRRLLQRYNLELARAVLLDAAAVTVTARGGWRDLFRAVKLARLMHRIERVGTRRYRVELTGPASPFVARTRRYGVRFARIFPAIARAPGWRIEAEIVREDREGGGRGDGGVSRPGEGGERGAGGEGGAGGEPGLARVARYTLEPGGPIRAPGRRRHRYDSRWERDLAEEFAAKLGNERAGWTLSREDTPVAVAEHVFLPDFTLRHADGREALVEIVGFWTPEYLRQKVEKIRAAGLDNLVVVVYRGLGAGAAAERLDGLAGPLVWFVQKPRIGPVLEAAERVAR